MIFKNGDFALSGEKIVFEMDDCGVTTGIGVFDTMLSRDGIPVLAEDHHARLIHDTQRVLRYRPEGLSAGAFQDAARALLAKEGLSSGPARIRTTVTGGKAARPLAPVTDPVIVMAAAPVPDHLPDIQAWVLSSPDYQRTAGSALENCKAAAHYMRSYGAKQDAVAKGGNDAIVLNTDGNAACATTSTLIILRDGIYYTPPLADGVLDGVTRKDLIRRGLIEEHSISLEWLYAAQGIYFANSITGVRAVSSLDGKALNCPEFKL